MGAYSNNKLNTFMMDTERTVVTNVRCLNNTPNDARTMIAKLSRCWGMLEITREMMAKNHFRGVVVSRIGNRIV